MLRINYKNAAPEQLALAHADQQRMQEIHDKACELFEKANSLELRVAAFRCKDLKREFIPKKPRRLALA